MNRPLILGSDGRPQRLPQNSYLSGNFVAVKANCVAQTFATVTFTKILFNNVSFDTNTHWNASIPGTITCKAYGLYHVCGYIQLPQNTAGDTILELRLNSTAIARSQFKNNAALSFQVDDLLYLNVNDILDLWFYQSQGSNLSLTSARLFMYRVGEP